MSDPSFCRCCNEIVLIGICEGCGYVQTTAGSSADLTRALIEAIEMQSAAEGDSGWIAAVNVTARAYAACGRWLAEPPGEA